MYYGQNGDNVAIFKGETGTIERFTFADGTSYSFAEMAALKGFTAPNDPPAAEHWETDLSIGRMRLWRTAANEPNYGNQPEWRIAA